jgi:hypothetical protein
MLLHGKCLVRWYDCVKYAQRHVRLKVLIGSFHSLYVFCGFNLQTGIATSAAEAAARGLCPAASPTPARTPLNKRCMFAALFSCSYKYTSYILLYTSLRRHQASLRSVCVGNSTSQSGQDPIALQA